MRLVGSEEELCFQLASYLRYSHPDVLFHFDFGSGTKLSMTQAVRQKRMNARSWPDLFVAKPRYYHSHDDKFLEYGGLFLELKREGTKLRKLDGSWVSPHVAEQDAVLEQLAESGYVAQFAVGLDHAIELIESYLGVEL